jgi:hypothetical protein
MSVWPAAAGNLGTGVGIRGSPALYAASAGR